MVTYLILTGVILFWFGAAAGAAAEQGEYGPLIAALVITLILTVIASIAGVQYLAS